MAAFGASQPTLTSVDVLVVGAGPVGLALALQAHQYGARVGVVERRPRLDRPSRAMLLWPRTLQALNRLGVAEELQALPGARLEATVHLGRMNVQVPVADLAPPGDSRSPLMVRQADVEAVLQRAVMTSGIPMLMGTELIGLGFDDGDAAATLSTPDAALQVKCRFVVGCDGADSTVRRLAKIPWRGRTYPQEAVLADLHVDGLTPSATHIGAGYAGIGFLFPAGEHGAIWRLVATRSSRGAETPPGQDGPPLPIPELQTIFRGANLPGRITAAAWSTRVRLQRRHAGSYQTGPVFLAGDAAHVFSPAGAQGMNTGLQDAANLGWKLATMLHGSTDPQALQRSYVAERRPVARRVGVLTGLLLRGEGNGQLPMRLTRTRLLPVLAPAVPTLLRIRPLTAMAGWVLSQGWVCYGTSPITNGHPCWPSSRPRPGCIAPAMPLIVGGRQVGLHDLTTEPGIHLLHGHAFPVEQLSAVPGVRIHRVDDWPAGRVLAVRPDGYIGYHARAGNPAPLRRWLQMVTGTATRVGAEEARWWHHGGVRRFSS